MNTEHHFEMPVHPVADLFPIMNADDLTALESNIKEHGLLHPIVVHEGQILDGRNRIEACRPAHCEPRFVEWRSIYNGSESIADWIWATNGERRHLTDEQYKIAQAATMAWKLQQEAKQRQREHGGTAPGIAKNETVAVILPQVSKRVPDVRAHIAKEIGLSEKKVQQVLYVQRANPTLLKQVIHGKVRLDDAAKQVPKRKSSSPKSPALRKPRTSSPAQPPRRFEDTLLALAALPQPVTPHDITRAGSSWWHVLDIAPHVPWVTMNLVAGSNSHSKITGKEKVAITVDRVLYDVCELRKSHPDTPLIEGLQKEIDRMQHALEQVGQLREEVRAKRKANHDEAERVHWSTYGVSLIEQTEILNFVEAGIQTILNDFPSVVA